MFVLTQREVSESLLDLAAVACAPYPEAPLKPRIMILSVPSTVIMHN
jgi:hypothetical protein